MISFAIDSVGATGDVCAGDGLVGEGGKANNLFGNTGRWWWLDLAVPVAEAGEPMTFLWMGE